MNSYTDLALLGLLVLLIFASAFFSSSETALMAINRYRLRHLVRHKNAAAIKVDRLLSRPDRLLGVLLIGNTFANILASSLLTLVAVRHFNDWGVACLTLLFTLFVLIFAEVAPKTFAAVAPERLSLVVARPLSFLLWLTYPLVFLANSVANGLLRLVGIKKPTAPTENLSLEELRTVVFEAGKHIPSQHQEMLLSILDLEKMKVEDVMVPRHEIKHIDLEDEMEDIIMQLTTATHTQLPLCEGGIDNVRGILHIRGVVNLLSQNKLTRKNLIHAARPAYYVPETTPLPVQLLHFRENKRRIALVVDEYGDIQGLVSMEDILEEIVGDLNFQSSFNPQQVQACDDGSYVVDGGLGVRELNRLLQWSLPIDGPKTLSGLIVERLESIPNPGTCLKIDNYYLEVLEIKGNLVRLASIKPAPKTEADEEASE